MSKSTTKKEPSQNGGGDNGGGDHDRGGSLVVATHMDVIDGWDPHLSTAWGSALADELVYSKLVNVSERMEIVPDLAESWNYIEDRTIEFKLRRGVKWHDGVDFTAEDVKYSIERILDPKNGIASRSKVESIEEVEIVDPFTIRFHLRYPDGALVNKLADINPVIVPKHILDAGGSLKTKPIGTGPFILTEHVPDSYIRFVKNPKYYEPGKPYLDELTLQIIKDDAVKIAALRAKQVDMINLSEMQHVEALRKDPSLVVVSQPSLTNLLAFPNWKNKPFDDKRVRKAISLAVNREEMLQVVGFGEGVITGLIPPSQPLWALPEQELKNAYKVDIAQAKRLLAEAGYPDGFSTTIQVTPTILTLFPQVSSFRRNSKKSVSRLKCRFWSGS